MNDELKNYVPGSIVAMPRDLSPSERFRLIEIAHETRDLELRRAAMDLLQGHYRVVWPG